MRHCLFVVVLVFISTRESHQQQKEGTHRIQIHGRTRQTPPKTKHPSLLTAVRSIGIESIDTVPIKNFFNREYTGQIGVGTPQQFFDVVFDTGSADLWIMSTETQQPQHPDFQNYYDHRLSTTYRPNGKDWEIKYGSGDASGFLSEDSVFLGPYEARKQLFGEGLVFDGFDDAAEPSDGIMGMGLQELSTQRIPTVMENLANNDVIDSNVFGFVLSKNENNGSYLVIGPPEEDEAFSNGITYNDILPPFWTSPMSAVTLNGTQRTDLCTERACVALLDSGTSFIGVPEDTYMDLMTSIIKDARGLDVSTGVRRAQCKFDMQSVNCVNTNNLPNVTFTFNGFDFTLTPDDYREKGGELGFMPIGAYDARIAYETDQFILGDTFIKTFPTVFDEDSSRIGFAHTSAVTQSSAVPGPTIKPSEPPPNLSNDLNKFLTRNVIFGLQVWEVGLIALGTIFIMCFMYSFCCRRRPDRSSRAINLQNPVSHHVQNPRAPLIVAVPQQGIQQEAPLEASPYIRMDVKM